MQRFLSAVVILSVGALISARAVAQTAPAAVAKPPASAKPSSGKSASEPAPAKKPDDRLSDEAELSRVVGLYEAGKYRECGSEIDRLLDPLGKAPLRQPGIIENARVYQAACLLGAGESDAADVPLRAAIHENPQMKPPDSLVFPQPVVDHFLKVRDSLVNEIREAERKRIEQAQQEARQRQQALAHDRDRMRALEKLASRETLVIKNSRYLAAVPFGAGQFQNREPALGYSLLVSEALLGGLSITSIIVQSRLATEATDLQAAGGTLKADYQQTQDAWGIAKRASFWAFAVLAVGGVVQAEIEFVPSFRETRTRPLPPSLSASRAPKPTDISAVPYFDQTGGGLAVMGRF
jgi:hypothetical protein